MVVGAYMITDGLSAQAPRGQGASAQDVVNGHQAVANEVLVKFTRPQTPGERSQTDALLDADRDNNLNSDDVRHIHSRRFDTAALVAFFAGAPNVEYAEPNYVLFGISTPNDPSFGQLWGLLNTGQVIGGQAGIAGADIDAVPAWDLTTGSTAHVVGVVDTGVDYNHPDLAANIWASPADFTYTIGGTNVLCAAGTHGFRSINGAMSCDPLDDNNHGTHVSGTIGAVGNNGVGVAGVNWTARIMGLKFLNSAGSGSTADAVNAIEFAIQAKNHFGAGADVRVLSNSWGGGGFSQTLLNEINKANTNNMLFVAAAGNNNSDNDTLAFYPADYMTSTQNVVAVAATDNRDNRASFSNYGATTVHLGAPGVNVLSTTRNNTYSTFSGTSMATPHVSGAAALVLSVCALNTADLKSAIVNNVDPIASLAGITTSGGRLNVNRALQSCAGSPSTPPPAPTGLGATGGNAQVTLNWNASSGATSYKIYRGTSPGGEAGTAVGSSATPTYSDTAVTNGTTYYYKVTAVNDNGESGPSNEAFATPAAPVAPGAPTLLSATGGPGRKKITLQWSAVNGATSYTVKRATSSGGPYSTVATGVTGTSFTNSGLASGTTYYYVVFAVNAGGTSPSSNQLSAKAP